MTVYHRDIGDGLAIEVYQMFAGNGRLTVTDGVGCWNSYCYSSVQKAIAAAEIWDGESEAPVGWHRHIDTARRRENGDPAKEYVHP